MTLRDFFRTLVKGWPVILISLVVTVAIAIVVLVTQETAYRASASVRVAVELPRDASEDALEAAADLADYQTVTVKALVLSDAVLEAVIEEESLDVDADELAEHIAPIAPAQTNVIEIRVTWPDAQGAADIANAIADQVVEDFSEGDEAVQVEVTQVKQAVPADAAAVPNPVATVGLAVFAGLWFSAAWLFVRAVRRARSSGAAE